MRKFRSRNQIRLSTIITVLVSVFIGMLMWMLVFSLASCSSEIEIYEDVPITKDWGKRQDAVDTFETPPYDDKFCKETLLRVNWN